MASLGGQTYEHGALHLVCFPLALQLQQKCCVQYSLSLDAHLVPSACVDFVKFDIELKIAGPVYKCNSFTS
eukprot:1160781-Pelagomonas_calceolata.AAC.15